MRLSTEPKIFYAQCDSRGDPSNGTVWFSEADGFRRGYTLRVNKFCLDTGVHHPFRIEAATFRRVRPD